ncbi:MAG: hypothetical protein EOO12_16805 [Chitinophagaceae bacterium]|nr:MAG: hypothetical protein EOO12_16805 [Chitinophagaceae bacterium]
MNRKINWIAIAVTVLVLVNIALLATIWLQKKNQVPAVVNAGERARRSLVRDIGFDSTQIHRYDSMRDLHRQRMRALDDALHNVKRNYFDGLLQNTPPNDSLLRSIGSLTQRVDSLTYEHFRHVQNLCTPEQKVKFDRIFRRVGFLVGRPRPQGPSPDGPPGGEGPEDDGPPHNRPPHDGPPEDGPPPGP